MMIIIVLIIIQPHALENAYRMSNTITFSSFNQSNNCFLALSLPSSLPKFPIFASHSAKEKKDNYNQKGSKNAKLS